MLLSMVSNSLYLYFYLWEGGFMLCKVLAWSSSLVLMKIVLLLAMKSGAPSPGSFPPPRGQMDFLKFSFLFETPLLGSRVPSSSISYSPAAELLAGLCLGSSRSSPPSGAAALPALLCWASPMGSVTGRVWCFLSSQQDNSCFPTVTHNYVKSLANIFTTSIQESLEGPCL